MSDVVIQRCVLRVRRHGGWSWGARPEELLRAATRALPGLIAARLVARVPRAGSAPLHMTAPVRVRVAARLDEFAELAARAALGAAAPGSGAFVDRVAAAIAAAVAGSAPDHPDALASPAAPRPEDCDAPHAARAPQGAVLAALVAWHRAGVIAPILAAFDEPTLSSWHATLVRTDVATEPDAAAVTALVERVHNELAASPSTARSPADLLRTRLRTLAAIIAEPGALPAAPVVAAALAELAPPPRGEHIPPADRQLSAGAGAKPPALPSRPAADNASTTEAPAAHRAGGAALPRRLDGELTLPSALPFLALVPLSRAGWLGTLAAALEAAAAPELGPLFAAGLAYKVLEPPARGWARSDGVRLTAAVVAGRPEPVADAELHALAPRAGALVTALDASAHAMPLAGHRKGAPLVLHRGQGSWLLTDSEGTFPLALAAELDDVLAAARAVDELVLVPSGAAGPATLELLDLANLRFVADAPPTRGEAWRTFTVDDRLAATNDSSTSTARLRLAFAELQVGAELARELHDALAARPALAPSSGAALERCLSLAAGLALGDMAWRLFHARERTTPVLALERFADLEARVTVSADAVRVRVPLGRRHGDLLAHGFLTTVSDVPWFDGRVLELGEAEMIRLDNLAIAHLVLRLRPLGRALRVAAARRHAASERLAEAGADASRISPTQVKAILDDIDDLLEHVSFSTGEAALIDAEVEVEQSLRARASAAGGTLPLDALSAGLGLDAFEIETLVLCAAPELDVGYELLFAFIHDDAQRRALSVELACGLTASSLHERVRRRQALSTWGRLRRLGLLTAREDGPSGLRAELRLSPLASHFLLGGDGNPAALFVDPAEMCLPAQPATPCGVEHDRFERLATALQRGDIGAVGVWAARPAAARDVALSLASHAAGRPLRRLLATDAAAPARAVEAAAVLGATLLLDGDETADAPWAVGLIDALARSAVPVVIAGTRPWRPAALLSHRAWADLIVAEPAFAELRGLWQAALPELDAARVADLASRWRFAAGEVAATVRTARAAARMLSNGHAVSAAEQVDDACTMIARQRSQRYATLLVPRRGPAELVLPPEQHARVLEIAAFHRALPRVMEEWRFGWRITGGGIKALFTGESGTGKTLAAEVVAGLLGLPLLKIDLARVISKWVGETEKNLDAAFQEAEESHSVLFFDEAEALFGARGEVQHGTDRYANLEVSFLLQRLEAYGGVAILATNVRDKIDPAFSRRFQFVVTFLRPAERERRRLWQVAFPDGAPLAGDLDLATLARLDLTGAGIVGAAQTAALLAAREGAAAIAMAHVTRALARQFQREARILSPAELGPHAVHLREES